MWKEVERKVPSLFNWVAKSITLPCQIDGSNTSFKSNFASVLLGTMMFQSDSSLNVTLEAKLVWIWIPDVFVFINLNVSFVFFFYFVNYALTRNVSNVYLFRCLCFPYFHAFLILINFSGSGDCWIYGMLLNIICERDDIIHQVFGISEYNEIQFKMRTSLSNQSA